MSNFVTYFDNVDVIMVSHDKKEKKFIFYDKKNILIGYFTINQLFKYIGSSKYPQFMSSIDMNTAIDIIETFIGSIKDDHFVVRNHIESPFMGNIEMLIKLNNSVGEFERSELEKYLSDISDNKLKLSVKQFIKQFIYILLNYTLRIISSISEQIKNDQNRKQVKQSLLNYSCKITMQVANYIKEHLDIQANYLDDLQKNLQTITSVKIALNNKLDKLTGIIDSQNSNINLLINKIDILQEKISLQKGGDNKLIIGKNDSDSDNSDSNENSEDNENNENDETTTSSDIIEEILSASSPQNTKISSHSSDTSPIKNVNPETKLDNINFNDLFNSENGYEANPLENNNDEQLNHLSSENETKKLNNQDGGLKDNKVEKLENVSKDNNKIEKINNINSVKKSDDLSEIGEIYNL